MNVITPIRILLAHYSFTPLHFYCLESVAETTIGVRFNHALHKYEIKYMVNVTETCLFPRKGRGCLAPTSEWDSMAVSLVTWTEKNSFTRSRPLLSCPRSLIAWR